ncbi:unnamed protein product [Arctogadus glacialis]
MSIVDAFCKAPSEELLQCTREQLVKIVEHFDISVGVKQLKDNVKSLLKSNLWEMTVLKSSVMPPVPICQTGFVSQEKLFLTFEQLKELFCLRMQLEMEMEVTLEVETVD